MGEPSEDRIRDRARALFERDHPGRPWASGTSRSSNLDTLMMAGADERAAYERRAREDLVAEDAEPRRE